MNVDDYPLKWGGLTGAIMNVEEVIADIEGCSSLEGLHGVIQGFIEARGFAEYSFLDNSRYGVPDPLIMNSIPDAWDRDYRSNNFLDADPCLPFARSTNTPFTWSDIKLPERLGKRKPRSWMVMEAAQDYSYTNGLVLPFHYRDHLGTYYSSVCTLFWTSSPKDFVKRLQFDKYEMHLVLLYWAQRAIDVSTTGSGGGRMRDSSGKSYSEIHLTDREREVLLWSAQGKTSEDTADIMGISRETVETHIKSCLAKLDAANRTQAVVRAIYLGMIVP